ncbi:MAG: MerR family transcriptional regulator [Anaerolineae bacterium]|nr:MerR family transcriptional regulator [Anaerolineae bacterium]
MKRYLTAKEVTDVLGITPATLYAYVSRGLIRSEATEADNRTKRYSAEDVYKLKERKEQRQNPAKAAQNALHWGTPILESSLTLITEQGPYYRGHSALKLADTSTIEQVAALFWTGDLAEAARLFASRAPINKAVDTPTLLVPHRLNLALTLASAEDWAAYNLRPEATALTGVRILKLTTAALLGVPAINGSITQAISAAWADDSAQPLLNAALILCVDHELNVSSFTARVVASAEAHPYAVVMGGLAALQGIRHGGSTERAEALLHEITNTSDIPGYLSERLRRGESIPGFGHPVYPDGDPRAAFLLDRMTRQFPDIPAVMLAQHVIEAARQLIDQKPNIDFALAALVHILQLPKGSGFALFALGRTIGWIGHAIEQYARGTMIRPRATYVGIPPHD